MFADFRLSRFAVASLTTFRFFAREKFNTEIKSFRGCGCFGISCFSLVWVWNEILSEVLASARLSVSLHAPDFLDRRTALARPGSRLSPPIHVSAEHVTHIYMPLARGARVFRSSRSWAPPPLLAALMLRRHRPSRGHQPQQALPSDAQRLRSQLYLPGDRDLPSRLHRLVARPRDGHVCVVEHMCHAHPAGRGGARPESRERDADGRSPCPKRGHKSSMFTRLGRTQELRYHQPPSPSPDPHGGLSVSSVSQAK